MDRYEKQVVNMAAVGVDIDEQALSGTRLAGLYISKKGSKPTICINPALSGREKVCVMAEEMGHHYRTCGNIISLASAKDRKQERAGRAWAFTQVLPLEEIAQAWLNGIDTLWDLADHFEVTEQFLMDAIDYYHQRYGEIKELPDGIIVQFDPHFDVFKAYE